MLIPEKRKFLKDAEALRVAYLKTGDPNYAEQFVNNYASKLIELAKYGSSDNNSGPFSYWKEEN